jgi:hypothetical protein
MKLNEIQMYKNIGSIQMCKDEDGFRFYAYTHFASGNTSDEDTIKGAKEMLDWEEKNYEEVQSAIRVLSGRGYKVFKEVA